MDPSDPSSVFPVRRSVRDAELQRHISRLRHPAQLQDALVCYVSQLYRDDEVEPGIHRPVAAYRISGCDLLGLRNEDIEIDAAL
jgi:hypothetical protein